MSVFLLVLKILGYILLGIIGLILLLLAIVLFVPFRYKAHGEFYDSPMAEMQVTWLLHIVRFKASYDGTFNQQLKVLWFLLMPKDESKQRTKSSNDAESINDKNISTCDEKIDEEPEINIESKAPAEKNQATEDEHSNDQPKKKKSRKKKKVRKPKAKSKLKELKEKYTELKAKIDDPRNRKAVVHIKDEIVILLKRIWPRSCEGYLQYGFNDPAITGEITGLVSLLPIAYQKRVNIIPDFASDETYFEGEMTVRGRFRVVTVVAIAVRLVLDKNVRYLYKQLG